MHALAEKEQPKSMGRKRKSEPGSGAMEPSLDELYDGAWENATERDKVLLTGLKALGHYPRESKGKTHLISILNPLSWILLSTKSYILICFCF